MSKDLRISSPSRLLWLLAQLALIFFSSSALVGEASEYAYRFYELLLRLPPTGVTHDLGQKGVHFILFFGFGVSLYYSLNVTRRWKICWIVGICFLVGVGSEGMQLLFAGRHASLTDVLLNGTSGVLAAVIASRRIFSSGPKATGNEAEA